MLLQKNKNSEQGYTFNILEMVEKVKSEPKRKMIYPGIKENSIGFVYGPAKSGKTIFCENLGLSIAAGLNSYLGKPINIENRKVLFISLEEFYHNRTERNSIQISKLLAKYGKAWVNNYLVVNNDMPRYIVTDEDWDIFYEIFFEHHPDVVIIDSLSRLYVGNIEESKVAKELMKNLRELANATNTTVIVIHHTPKLSDSTPLTINTVAGSRIIAQDADFIIGINRTVEGERYMKDVAFRYAQEDSETVSLLKLDENLWFEKIGEAEESSLLTNSDGRYYDGNKVLILELLKSKSDQNGGIVDIGDIKEQFNGKLSSQTIHNQLKALVSEGSVIKPSQGKYKAVA